MTRALFVGTLMCTLAVPCVGRAQSAWFDLRVPGSISGLLQSAGVDAEPADELRLTQHLLRRLQEVGEVALDGDGNESDAWSRPGRSRVRNYVDAFRFLRMRWLAVQRSDGEVSLGAANDRRSRRSLEAFLEILGLSLVRDRGATRYRVVSGGRGRRRSSYGQWLDTVFTGAGWQPERIRARLNAGETIDWDPGHFVVALPLDPPLWRGLMNDSSDGIDMNSTVFAPDVAADLLARIIADPDWARFHSGLVALDSSTLAYVADNPRTLGLFRNHIGAFADYASHLRVHEGRVQTPGDDIAREEWEALAGASVSAPYDFLSGLFGRSSGRLAFFFDTVARLPAAHQRYTLGAWQDEPARRRGFDALWGMFDRMRSEADEVLQELDPAAILRALTVQEDGSPRGPASPEFWRLVFRDREVTEQESEELSERWDDAAAIDAAFVLGSTLYAPAGVGRDRLRTFCFVQRVFYDGDRDDVQEVLTVARAFDRFSMLLLSLERMGIRDATVHAGLLRSARRLGGVRDRWIDSSAFRRSVALSRFQGAVALVERARLAGVLSVTSAGEVLVALAELPPRGSVAGWLAEHLLPALNLSTPPDVESGALERELLAVLAGAHRGAGASGEMIAEWEGLEYRFDRGAMQFGRVRRTRAELSGPTIDTALMVWRQMDRLARKVEDVTPVAETFIEIAASVEVPESARAGANARSVAYARRLRSEAATLIEIAEAEDMNRLAEAVLELGDLVATLTADALRTLIYAVHLSLAEGLFDADLAARHDFGVDPGADAGRLRTPWTTPAGIATPEGWSVQGSLLSLDLALAHLYLPRVSRVLPSGGQRFLDDQDVRYLTYAVTLFNPASAGAGQVDRIAEAIRRGRNRVKGLAEDATGVSDLAREIRLHYMRRHELERAANAGAEELDRILSRTELFWLGWHGKDAAELMDWGAPTTPLDGCLCLRMPFPDDVEFHATTPGGLAFRFADLQLALVEAVDRLKLPASIIRDLLPIATREMLDGARVTHDADIEALVRYVNELSASRIEDYVASLVYSGPFFSPGSADSDSGW